MIGIGYTVDAASLPAVILSYIFERAVVFSEYYPSVREAPLNVSQTCRSWRAIALANGRFWARLQGWVHPRIASLWISRSGNALLDFSIEGYRGTCGDEDFEDWHASLFRHHSRWRRIRSSLNYSQYVPRAPPGLTDLSNLKEWEWGFNMDIFPFRFGEDLGLRTMFLIPDPWEAAHPIAPQLSRLSICFSQNSRIGLLAMLQHCPRLHSLEITSEWGPKDIVDPDDPICSLKHLEELSLRGIPALYLSVKLRAPSLQSLVAKGRDSLDYPVLSSTIPQFLSKSQHGVPVRTAVLSTYTSFFEVFYTARMDEIGVGQLLQALPDVTHLTMCFRDMTSVCNLLSFGAEGGGLCQHLERLHVRLLPRHVESAVRMLLTRFHRCEAFRATVEVSKRSCDTEFAIGEHAEMESFIESGRLIIDCRDIGF